MDKNVKVLIWDHTYRFLMYGAKVAINLGQRWSPPKYMYFVLYVKFFSYKIISQWGERIMEKSNELLLDCLEFLGEMGQWSDSEWQCPIFL